MIGNAIFTVQVPLVSSAILQLSIGTLQGRQRPLSRGLGHVLQQRLDMLLDQSDLVGG